MKNLTNIPEIITILGKCKKCLNERILEKDLCGYCAHINLIQMEDKKRIEQKKILEGTILIQKTENTIKNFLNDARKLLDPPTFERFGGIFLDIGENNIFLGHVIIPKQDAQQGCGSGQNEAKIDMISWIKVMKEQQELKRKLIGFVFSNKRCGVYLSISQQQFLQQANKNSKDKLFLLIINYHKDCRIFMEGFDGKII